MRIINKHKGKNEQINASKLYTYVYICLCVYICIYIVCVCTHSAALFLLGILALLLFVLVHDR